LYYELVQLCQLMVTFHVIEATQLHGSLDAEQFADSLYARYRFVTEDSGTDAKVAAKSDESLDTGSVSDDVFVSSKPLYVHVYYVNHSD